MRRASLVIAALLLVACSDTPPGATTSASAPRHSGPRINTSAAPITSAEPSQPPIRKSPGKGPVVDGASLEVRPFVSRITTTDPLHLAIQLVPETPIGKDHPWLTEMFNLDEALATFEYEVVPLVGDGKKIRGRKGTE